MALVTSLTELGCTLLGAGIELNGSISGPDLDRIKFTHCLTRPQPACRPFLVLSCEIASGLVHVPYTVVVVHFMTWSVSKFSSISTEVGFLCADWLSNFTFFLPTTHNP